ncbi:MAG TPA: DUF4870 domain-containing protein [Bellilinea sp.]|nr:DUF4870 domain-containing protein [Bellilinea sp.]
MSNEPVEVISPNPDVTDDDKLWGLLSYLLAPLVPLILFLMEDKKKRPYIKLHQMQGLLLGLALFIINLLLTPIPFVSCVTGPLSIVIMIYYAIKAYKGETFEIPVISNVVKSQGWA